MLAWTAADEADREARPVVLANLNAEIRNRVRENLTTMFALTGENRP
jgi:hypothetical protein